MHPTCRPSPTAHNSTLYTHPQHARLKGVYHEGKARQGKETMQSHRKARSRTLYPHASFLRVTRRWAPPPKTLLYSLHIGFLHHPTPCMHHTHPTAHSRTLCSPKMLHQLAAAAARHPCASSCGRPTAVATAVAPRPTTAAPKLTGPTSLSKRQGALPVPSPPTSSESPQALAQGTFQAAKTAGHQRCA